MSESRLSAGMMAGKSPEAAKTGGLLFHLANIFRLVVKELRKYSR